MRICNTRDEANGSCGTALSNLQTRSRASNLAFSVRLASASISVQAFLGEAAGTDRRILDEIDQIVYSASAKIGIRPEKLTHRTKGQIFSVSVKRRAFKIAKSASTFIQFWTIPAVATFGAIASH